MSDESKIKVSVLDGHIALPANVNSVHIHLNPFATFKGANTATINTVSDEKNGTRFEGRYKFEADTPSDLIQKINNKFF